MMIWKPISKSSVVSLVVVAGVLVAGLFATQTRATDYPVTPEQAKQIAREWVGMPNLEVVIDGMMPATHGDVRNPFYDMHSASPAMTFLVDAVTGHFFRWEDKTLSSAAIHRRSEKMYTHEDQLPTLDPNLTANCGMATFWGWCQAQNGAFLAVLARKAWCNYCCFAP